MNTCLAFGLIGQRQHLRALPTSPDASHDRGTHTPGTEATVVPGHSISIHTGGTSGWRRALSRRAVVPAGSRDGTNDAPGANVVVAPSLNTSRRRMGSHAPGPRSTLTLRRGPGPGDKDKKNHDSTSLANQRCVRPPPTPRAIPRIRTRIWTSGRVWGRPRTEPHVRLPHHTHHPTVGEQDPDRPPKSPQASEHLPLTRCTNQNPPPKGEPDTPTQKGPRVKQKTADLKERNQGARAPGPFLSFFPFLLVH